MTSLDTAAPTAELGRYMRTVTRRWPVLVVGALLGALLAGLYVLGQPTQATASALVSLNVISQEPFDSQRQPSELIDAQTEVQTARSSAVVQRTSDALGGTTQSEVRSSLKAELLPDATVMRITYTGDTVAEAVAGADEVAQQFLDYRGEAAAARLDAIAQRLSERRDLLRDDLREVNQTLADAKPNSSERAQALADRQLLDLELTNLVTKINALNAIDTTGGSMLTYASDVGAFVSPNKSLIMVSGVLAGLLLGIGAAFVRELRDRRVRDALDVATAGGGALLARLIGRKPDQAGADDALCSAWEHVSAGLAKGPMVVMLTDVAAPAESSQLALDLAVALAGADARLKVELVSSGGDAPLTASGSRDLHLYTKPPLPGWTQYGSRTHQNLVVSVAQSGTSTNGLRDHVVRQGRNGPIRIVAVPSTAGRAAVLGVARECSAVVLVAIHAATRHRDLRALRAELDGVHAPVRGTILTRRRRHVRREEPADLPLVADAGEEQIVDDAESVKT